MFYSNTVVGLGNNSVLKFNKATEITSRIFVKPSVAGKYNYKFFFSNNVFSTYDDGSVSKANDIGGSYLIKSAFVGVCRGDFSDKDDIKYFPVLFNGKAEKCVKAGEVFRSDSVLLDLPENYYIVYKWTVQGDVLPYTPDKLCPCEIYKDGKFVSDNAAPQPNKIECDRAVNRKIAFLGDSITQGLGTVSGEYEFWVANIGKALVEKGYGVMNLGLGFGRAQDAATEGAWLDCTEGADIVNVCFGVNDILQGRSLSNIITDLKKITSALISHKFACGIFTVPPFDLTEEKEQIRVSVNQYIKTELSKKVLYIFDFSKILAKPYPENNIAAYGGHPDKYGCLVVAKKFLENKNIMDKLFCTTE